MGKKSDGDFYSKEERFKSDNIKSKKGFMGVRLERYPFIDFASKKTDQDLCLNLLSVELQSWMWQAIRFLDKNDCYNCHREGELAYRYYLKRLDKFGLDQIAMAYKHTPNIEVVRNRSIVTKGV